MHSKLFLDIEKAVYYSARILEAIVNNVKPILVIWLNQWHRIVADGYLTVNIFMSLISLKYLANLIE